MIRYLTSGKRNFRVWPDPVSLRNGWEFYALHDGCALPIFSNSVQRGRDAVGVNNSPSQTETRSLPEMENSSMTLWLIRPRITYHWESGGKEVNRSVFHFTHVHPLVEDFLGDATFFHRKLDPGSLAKLVSVYRDLLPHYIAPTDLLQLHSEKALAELSLLLFENEVGQNEIHFLNRRESERTQKAIEYYQANMRKRPTMAQVAESIGLSISQMRRDFKLVHGRPPQAVFHKLRLNEAMRLMATNDWTLDRIYADAGFGSKQDFHRSFKEEHGVSPHKWRRQTATGKDPGLLKI